MATTTVSKLEGTVSVIGWFWWNHSLPAISATPDSSIYWGQTGTRASDWRSADWAMVMIIIDAGNVLCNSAASGRELGLPFYSTLKPL